MSPNLISTFCQQQWLLCQKLTQSFDELFDHVTSFSNFLEAEGVEKIMEVCEAVTLGTSSEDKIAAEEAKNLYYASLVRILQCSAHEILHPRLRTISSDEKIVTVKVRLAKSELKLRDIFEVKSILRHLLPSPALIYIDTCFANEIYFKIVNLFKRSVGGNFYN